MCVCIHETRAGASYIDEVWFVGGTVARHGLDARCDCQELGLVLLVLRDDVQRLVPVLRQISENEEDTQDASVLGVGGQLLRDATFLVHCLCAENNGRVEPILAVGLQNGLSLIIVRGVPGYMEERDVWECVWVQGEGLSELVVRLSQVRQLVCPDHILHEGIELVHLEAVHEDNI